MMDRRKTIKPARTLRLLWKDRIRGEGQTERPSCTDRQTTSSSPLFFIIPGVLTALRWVPTLMGSLPNDASLLEQTLAEVVGWIGTRPWWFFYPMMASFVSVGAYALLSSPVAAPEKASMISLLPLECGRTSDTQQVLQTDDLGHASKVPAETPISG